MADQGALREPLPGFAWRPVGVVVVLQAVLLTALAPRYGFHRDELYFLAAGKRLAWGYVDQPPATPALARLSTAVFGESPAGLRAVATLLGVLIVLLVALLAREFGGGRWVQVAVAVATALSSYLLVVTHMLATNTADVLVWTAFALAVLRLLRTGNPRWWPAVGAVVGLGLLNKWLVLLLVAAVGIGVLAVGPRAVLRSWWLAAGVLLALLIAAPGVIWQAQHGFPMLEVAGGISTADGTENRILLVPMQIVYLAPLLVPVWVTGFLRLCRDPALRWARSFAVGYPVLLVILLVVGGKPYYAVPLLLPLLAAGAEPTLRWLGRVGRGTRATFAVLTVLSVAVSVVVGLPVLPASALNGVLLAMNKEPGEQVGWPRVVATVSTVWQRIPAAARDRSVILTANYGEAGAVERYRADVGLPQPYSGHMSYADWGPPPDRMTGQVLLVGPFDKRPAALAALHDCHVVDTVATGIDNDEQGTRVWLCAGTAAPWSVIWPRLRTYYT